MFKHILVAVDGNDTSNLAMKTAIKLAKKQHACHFHKLDSAISS